MNKETDSKNPLWHVWRWKLHWQILLGLFVGALVGVTMGMVAMLEDPDVENYQASKWVKGTVLFQFLKLFGDLFLNGLKLVILPLVTSSIVLSIANIGKQSGFGRLGLKTLAYYMMTSTIAVIVGIGLVNMVRPGASSDDGPILDPTDSAAMSEFKKSFQPEGDTLTKSTETAQEELGATVLEKVLNVFRRMIPTNVVEAAAELNLLGLIVVSLLIGFYLSRLRGAVGETMDQFWKGMYDITMAITDLILKFAPIGIACLLATTLSENYASLAGDGRIAEFISSLVWFGATVVFALAFHVFVVMPCILYFVAGINPIKHIKAMAPALLTAFSTSSSNATLPLTLECVEERAGVSRTTASFVLPLGATVNMDGTALYECIAAMFVVQLFGFDLDFGVQFLVVMIALLTSIGVAGVPSASLVAIVIILQSVGSELDRDALGVSPDFKLEDALPILLILDRPLDMCRTAVNVFSDSCGAAIIAKTEGETDLYPENPEEELYDEESMELLAKVTADDDRAELIPPENDGVKSESDTIEPDESESKS